MTVTIVTQTSVRPEAASAFAAWQHETSSHVSDIPGFVEQEVVPPTPTQPDWVILQRFSGLDAAQNWLHSPERAKRLELAAPMLLGRDDVTIVRDETEGVLPAPVSVVFTTKVKPGKEDDFQAWERRMAAVQSQAPGFQGYRFEPPVDQVQESFVAIMRFDSQESLDAWLASPLRKKLVKEAEPFVEDLHTFVSKSGFDHWFASGGPGTPPAWKMNMTVLLMLYPVVFLFGFFVSTPFLIEDLNTPFAIALFIGNVVSVILLTWLVPWAGKMLKWWLQPDSGAPSMRTTLLGVVVLLSLYAAMIVVFWKLF